MAYIFTQMAKGTIPDIYVQDEKYFAEYKEEIKKWYSEGIVPVDKISLHIRLGDYVGNTFYVDLTRTDYYKKALEQFPNEHFLVFCKDGQRVMDDIRDTHVASEFVRSLLPEGNFEMAPFENDEIQDFNLMAGCKGHITANSSFSWWASYVGGGKTIAPKEWFTDGVERISIPSEWLRL